MTRGSHHSMREQRTVTNIHSRDTMTPIRLLHSMRENRTVANVQSRESKIPQSCSNLDVYLEKKFSDDSSIFSGLVDQENDEQLPPPPPPLVEIRQLKGILRASSHAGPIYDPENNARESNEHSLQNGSSLSESEKSQRSAMRDLRSMVDSVFSSGNSTMSTDPSSRREDNSIRDGDNNTQMTWASANEMKRSTGSVALVSSVKFVGDEIGEEEKTADVQFVSQCSSSDSDSRIVEMLDNFERQMDANIQSLGEDTDENNVLADFNKNIVSYNNDVQAQKPQGGHFLDPHEATKLQRMLHKAKIDVEVLRDNNEQYKSEIEQMEEEHRSEIKLVEERAKRKLVELKNMYQNEIDNLHQEKDAAVVEAGRVAVRYAETGKKRVSTMQKQVDKLKTAAAITMREKIRDERESTTSNKDKEIMEKLKALRKSHGSELEKVLKESDERLELEVEKTVASVAKRVKLNQDDLINELRTQNDELRIERHSTIELLESVKRKFTKHYPEQMIEYNEKSFSGSAQNALENSGSPVRGVEKALTEVIEIFSFLLEGEETKVALAKEQSTIEENKKDSRRLLVLRHRAEIETLTKEKEEKNERFRKLEKDFCLLHGKFQRESESQNLKLERKNIEKETFLNIARSRKDLEHAMAEGQRELAQSKVRSEEGPLHVSSSRYSLSIPTPIGTSDALNRPADQQRSMDMLQAPSIIEPTSIKKARTFQKNHPKFMPRYSARNSTRHRPSEYLSSKAVYDPSDGRSQMPRNIVDNPETSDCRSIASNCSLQSISDLRNQVREAEDQVFGIINTMSDNTSKASVSTDKSIRSKDTILSNQSKKPKMNCNVKFEEQERMQEKEDSIKLSVDEKLALSNEESCSTPKRKKLAMIRRKIKTKKEGNQSPRMVMVIKKEVDEKTVSTDLMRRARVFKQHVERNRQDDGSLRSRRSLDGSISSLQTFTNKDTREDFDQIIHNIEKEQESIMSELVSETESKGDAQIPPAQFLHKAHDNKEKFQAFENEEVEPLRELSTHLNFKKPPISVDGSAKSKHISGKKGSVVTDDPQETISNLMVYDSHAQMRKIPPLTDDSDEVKRGAYEQDEYQTIEPNISEDNSLGIEKNSVPMDDARRSTYRRSWLAAVRPTKSYDTNSTAGSSVSEATTAATGATTTVTGHTRKSISFLHDPRRSRSNANKVDSIGTKRFAALKARVRVKKV